jgi:hypothetical protein
VSWGCAASFGFGVARVSRLSDALSKKAFQAWNADLADLKTRK